MVSAGTGLSNHTPFRHPYPHLEMTTSNSHNYKIIDKFKYDLSSVILYNNVVKYLYKHMKNDFLKLSMCGQMTVRIILTLPENWCRKIHFVVLRKRFKAIFSSTN